MLRDQNLYNPLIRFKRNYSNTFKEINYSESMFDCFQIEIWTILSYCSETKINKQYHFRKYAQDYYFPNP